MPTARPAGAAPRDATSASPGADGSPPAARADATGLCATDMTLSNDHLALSIDSVTGTMAESLLPAVDDLARTHADALRNGHKLITFGNGGSAADAQHFAAELLGRFRRERGPMPAITLTSDPSTVSGIGNDYGWGEVFARQIEALAAPGDVVVAISTSGRSENVVRGLAAAHGRGATTVALSGNGGGRAAPVADRAIVVPSGTTARIQEMHGLVVHLVCERIDEELLGREAR